MQPIYNNPNNNHNMTSYDMGYNGCYPFYPSMQQIQQISMSPIQPVSIHQIQPIPLHSEEPIDGEYFVSIDVECAATGYGHFDSAPCRIAMVDFYGNILFDRIANVPNLVDPLFEFTGLTKWDIQNKGESLSNVLAEFHDILSSMNKMYKFGVTIIGQSVVMDIIWTQLRCNVHYNRVVDIAHQFRTKQNKWSKFQYYSLRQVAWALLDCQMNDRYHDPTEDARVTIKLYRDFCLNANVLNAAKDRLIYFKHNQYFPDFRILPKFNQCSGMYSPSKCSCGQKVALGVDGVEHIPILRKLYNKYQKTHI